MNSKIQDIKCLFPPDTKIISFAGSPEKYSAVLRSKCKSKEEFRQNWLRQYEKLSRVTLRVLLTRPKTGKTVVYKAAFRCQHNTYPTSHQRVKIPHRKHTGCPAILKVTIKASPENRRVRSVDSLRSSYPTIININHDHNHNLPNQVVLIGGFKDNCKNNKSYFNVLRNCYSESELIPKEVKFNGSELDWNTLKLHWNFCIEKWELSNSIPLFKALAKATSYLENCKTVNATIAAINCIGKVRNKRKHSSEALVRPIIHEKMQQNDTSSCSNGNCCFTHILSRKPESSDAVDELLVIDQGWIT